MSIRIEKAVTVACAIVIWADHLTPIVDSVTQRVGCVGIPELCEGAFPVDESVESRAVGSRSYELVEVIETVDGGGAVADGQVNGGDDLMNVKDAITEGAFPKTWSLSFNEEYNGKKVFALAILVKVPCVSRKT